MTYVAAVIPALNEALNLPHMLAQIPRGEVQQIIIVDGGSSDGTPEVAARAGATVIVEPRRGYGRALAAGVAASPAATLYVFLDADGADDPREIPRLLAPLRAGEADLVLGSRLAAPGSKTGMLPHQRFGNRLAGRLIRLLFGAPLTDLAPFRAVRADVLRALHMRELTYGWPTEMIVKALRRGYRVREVPVSHHPRGYGESKISGTFSGTVLAAYYILSTTFRYAWTPLPD
jgi:hypothetical protein